MKGSQLGRVLGISEADLGMLGSVGGSLGSEGGPLGLVEREPGSYAPTLVSMLRVMLTKGQDAGDRSLAALNNIYIHIYISIA